MWKSLRSRSELQIAIVVAATAFIVLSILISLADEDWRHQAGQRAQTVAFDQAKNLERNINQSLAGARLLGQLVEMNQGANFDFKRLAQSMLINLPGITNLQLAPDGIIRQIHPLAGNEKAIGHDLLKDDRRRTEARLAVHSRQLTLAGPFQLVQGGVAIVGRQPVFINDHFWGFATALIRMEQVLGLSDLESLNPSEFRYRLWRLHPDTGQPQTIAGENQLSGPIKAQANINLPNSEWQLDIAYQTTPIARAAYSLALAIALLLSTVIGHWSYNLLARPRQLESRVAKKTAELATANRRLSEEHTQLTLFRNAVEQSGNVIMITDRAGRIEYVNPQFSRVTGYPSEEVVGKTPAILKSRFTSETDNRELWDTLTQGEVWRGERRNRKRDGSLYWSLLQISPIRNEAGSVTHFVSVSDDITDSKENQLLIEKLAYHDSLTGLSNRRYFIDRLEQAVRYGERHNRCAAVFFLDLDRFKAVNDSLGHQAGDELLIEVADRLLRLTRKSDLCARLGGDEFTILLTEVDCVQGVFAAAEKIISGLREPIVAAGQPCEVSASIGISLIGKDHMSAGQVLRQADMALYMAKNAGRDQFRVYQAEKSLHNNTPNPDPYETA